MSNHANHRGHAAVIGGSLSGLLAARVLSNHFEKVTVLERDTLPNGPEFRSGVPQARHGLPAVLLRRPGPPGVHGACHLPAVPRGGRDVGKSQPKENRP